MKREELTALGVPEGALDRIMDINGKDIEKHKAAAEAAKAQAGELASQLAQREADIADLKKVDAAGLQAKLDELRGKYDADRAAWEEKEQRRAYEDRRRDFFSGVEFADDYARRGVLAEFDERAFQYSDADKAFVGAGEWLEKLRETSPTAFKSAVRAPEVVRPASGGGGGELTKEAFGKMGYRERLALKNAKPDLYEKLTKE